MGYSPAPWTLKVEGDSICIYAASGALVARVSATGSLKERWRNARVMTGAPEALEALREAEQWIASHVQPGAGHSLGVLSRVRAAIARMVGT